MEYDYEDSDELPDLMSYRNSMIEEVLKSIFFQKQSKKIWNMLKTPIISAPVLLGNPVNGEVSKKTLLEKQFSYKEETIAIFQHLVNSKKLNIGQIGKMKPNELRLFAKKLKIDSTNKSNEIWKTDLVNLSRILLGGQVAIFDKCFF